LSWLRHVFKTITELDQFMLQYYSFKAENIAKQQKC
jgi:hypothetical protein